MNAYHLLIGTYTEPILFGTGEVFQGKGQGVYRCNFDGDALTMENLYPLCNPSYLCVNSMQTRIYAVNEGKSFHEEPGGGITVLSFNGQLADVIAEANTGGGDPCHVALSPDERLLVIANFAAGSVTAYALDEAGDLASSRQLFQHIGSSVHPIRQRGPHAHSAIFAGKDMFFVPDLGLDKLVAYHYENGVVTPFPALDVPVTPGSGPRYGEFSQDQKHFYLINELKSSVTHFVWNGEHLAPRETLSTLPKEYEGNNICSDLHLSQDGRYLYASNRGHDSISTFAVDHNGELSLLDITSCYGKTPRNFCIDPEGLHLMAGNQDSDQIAIFDIAEDGRLVHKKNVDFPSPVCIRLLKG